MVGNEYYDLYDFISQSLQMMPLFRTEFKYIEIGLLCNQQYLELSLTINRYKFHTMCKFVVSLLLQFTNSHFQPWLVALVCFASCRLKFIIIGKQLALTIYSSGVLHKVLGVFYMLKRHATSPFSKYIISGVCKWGHVTVTVTLSLYLFFKCQRFSSYN